MKYDAPGIGGPPDIGGEAYLELVAELMQSGLSQDDAEIEAYNQMEEEAEMARMDRGAQRFEELDS